MPLRWYVPATDEWVSWFRDRPNIPGQSLPPPASPPDPVTALTVSVPAGTYNTVRITWTAPVDDGGAPVMFYRLARIGGATEQQVPAPTTSFDWTGLPAVPATFQVVAVNAAGDSAAVTSSPVTPISPPVNPPPPPGNPYFGWDPASWSAPPERSFWAFHHNSGLFLQADRDALRTHAGNFTTSQAGQRIERLDITGDLIVNHPDVKVSRCRIRGEVDSTPLTSGPPQLYYCDVLHLGGAASTALTNMTRGHVQAYCCVIAGYIDAIAIKVSAISKTPLSVMRDCFVHSPRMAMDNFYSPPEPSHTDILGQCNQAGGVKMDYLHNTVFLTAAVNFGGTSEGFTRSSGPGWGGTGTDPASSSITFRQTGGDSGGRINTGFMLKNGVGARIRFHRNLFRGYAYSALNCQPGSTVECVDNQVAPGELDRATNPFGNPSNFSVYRGNKNVFTGAQL